jgi:hypothetical protein
MQRGALAGHQGQGLPQVLRTLHNTVLVTHANSNDDLHQGLVLAELRLDLVELMKVI